MSAYETIFVIKGSLTDEEGVEAVEKVKSIIQRTGGEVSALENWGRRKLAYEVKKEKRGIYIILHFKSEAATRADLERNFRLIGSVIKFMIVKIEMEQLGKIAPLKEEKPISLR